MITIRSASEILLIENLLESLVEKKIITNISKISSKSKRLSSEHPRTIMEYCSKYGYHPAVKKISSKEWSIILSCKTVNYFVKDPLIVRSYDLANKFLVGGDSVSLDIFLRHDKVPSELKRKILFNLDLFL